MPQSLILKLTAQSAIAPRYQQGHALQQLFFELVEAVDPRLGQILLSDPTNRSYSFSPLQCPRPSRSKQNALQYNSGVIIPAQTQCWWRITLLDDPLFDSIGSLWQSLCGERFDLGTAYLTIDEIIVKTPTPNRARAAAASATACSYSELYAQASDYERNIHIEFLTPVVFEHQGTLSPMPSADSLFQPLRKYWNHYSGLLFPANLVNYLLPTYFDIRTCSVQSFLHSSVPNISGCIGKIGFRIDEQHNSAIIKHLNTLADFARFCSVGYQAQFGMGVLGRSHPPLARSTGRSADQRSKNQPTHSAAIHPAATSPTTIAKT